MPRLQPPTRIEAPPRELVDELRTHWPEPRVVRTCVALLRGEPASAHADALPYLAGRAAVAFLDGSWTEADHWPRVWGARGLLYAWDDSASGPVVAGVADPAWRVAEMCLKVAARHELPVGEAAVARAGHPLPRVRVAAVRALGAGGDVEHVTVVASALDDEDESVRRTADRALARLRNRLDLHS